ncbi:FAD-binding protein [Salinibacterium sp. dk2585]|uniref:FAD-dependent monooxygenase n=1 Tax=unclassified Salinibacterium TaxID=2632331 RepID=UPI0011C24300|nr:MULTISPECIES: FAD-dependent monooxygenase [unclassified Salinibacterium]QEE60421.1 FAD-binding protein [Salinibacterium sp. dk2585]TXK55494.1 FAD-binding protein [Salinibacterium sp. dk5596]
MNSTQPTHDVLVLGGGIGGLATAIALADVGRTVHLVEQAAEFGEIGAGLQLGPNAIRSLDRLGVWDEVKKTAVFPSAGIIMDAMTGEELTRLDLGPAFIEHYGYPYVVAHRADLHSILVEACRRRPEITLETNRRVVEVTESADAAAVTFADGDQYVSKTVIGGDGIRSRTRLQFDDSEPKFTGQTAYRGTVPTELVDLDSDDVILWMGPNFHMIQYPVRAGELYNQVAVIESKWHAQGREDWGTRAELDEVTRDACDEVKASLAMLTSEQKWPIYDRDPMYSWSTEHTVLIGDAAHAMRQYLGQGACQALEDALVLAQAVARHPEQSAAFAEYEERRVPRGTRCQEVSRPWGDLWHTEDPTLQLMRNKYFKMRAADDYSELDWLYNDHVGELSPARA